MIERIASSSLIPSVAIVQAPSPRVMQPQEMTAVLDAPAARASAHSASQVALAPLAMSALIEAQEHMAGPATPSDRSLTGQKIDHILARLADAAPGTPEAAVVPGGFSVRMLVAARQQLCDSFV